MTQGDSARLFSALIALGAAQTAMALPEDQKVVYRIHETPSDPESPAAYVVTLLLSAETMNGDDVGWRVAEIKIARASDSPPTLWYETLPEVDTGDGLWWIAHSDGEAPSLEEFTEAPPIAGTADAEAPSGDDLEYEIEGSVYAPPPPPGTPPYAVTGSLSYSFKLESTSEPEGEGEEVPVETGDDEFF